MDPCDYIGMTRDAARPKLPEEPTNIVWALQDVDFGVCFTCNGKPITDAWALRLADDPGPKSTETRYLNTRFSYAARVRLRELLPPIEPNNDEEEDDL